MSSNFLHGSSSPEKVECDTLSGFFGIAENAGSVAILSFGQLEDIVEEFASHIPSITATSDNSLDFSFFTKTPLRCPVSWIAPDETPFREIGSLEGLLASRSNKCSRRGGIVRTTVCDGAC